MINDTIIKWNQVNMRGQEKNLPDEHSDIVYYYKGKINSGIVSNMKGKLTVNASISKGVEIKTGFIWCYQKDIPVPEEV